MRLVRWAVLVIALVTVSAVTVVDESGLAVATGAASSPHAITAPSAGEGYWLVSSDGQVFAYGDAPFYGSVGATALNKPVVAMAATPDGGGYWLAASDGGIFNYGDASFYGSTGAITLNKPVAAMAATPDGGGYWLAASDGGIFNYGDAPFYGSTGAMALNKPVVAMAATPDGKGYWLVASDGGIFNYGDAPFYGSTGAMALNKPVVAMAATPDGKGYWLVASDGGIFAYGDASFYGSTGAMALNKPVVAMAATPDGKGYWLVASDGGIFAYGDAPFYGSTGAMALNKPVVAMVRRGSPRSRTVNATNAVAPSAPAGLTASAVSSSSLRVTWTNETTAQAGGVAVATYTLNCAGSGCSTPQSVSPASGSTTSVTLSGLAASTMYDLKLTATNQNDLTGPASTTAAATQAAAPAPSSTTTQQSASATGEGSLVIGPSGTVTDTATVSGNTTAGAPTGTVTFTECGPSTSTQPCTSGSQVGSAVTLGSTSSSTSGATSASFKPAAVGTYCFAALYTPASGSNYSGSSDNMGTSADLNECVSVTPAPSSTTTQQSASATGEGSLVIGPSGTVTDTATVSGNTTAGAPTGTVTFTECGPSTSTQPCTSGSQVGSAVTLGSTSSSTSGATSASFKPAAVGTYCFAALYTPASGSNYSGSSDNMGTSADLNECVTAGTTPSSTTTQQSASATGEGSLVIGPSGTVTDTASVKGNSSTGAPTGTVTFTECGPSTSTQPCTSGSQVGSAVTLGSTSSSTSGATSASFKPAAVGTYCFAALYTPASGSNYSGSSDNMGTSADLNECVSVTPAPSSTTTQQSASATGEGSLVIGPSGTVTDTATVSGNTTAGAPTGTVTFTECGPSTSTQPCTSGSQVGSAVTLGSTSSSTSGATSASFKPAAVGTYCFAALYTPASGSNYSGSSDNMGTSADLNECVSVTPAGTWPATPADSGGVVCGQSILNSPYNLGNQSAKLGTTSNVVDVTTGNFGSTNFAATNTTFYFAPGTYTATQEGAGLNDWYVGEYSAGTRTTLNFDYSTSYGFLSPDTPGSSAINDTFEYMTMSGTKTAILGFGGAPDYVSGSPGGLAVLYSTLENSYGSGGGIGIELGSYDNISYDCLTHNGEYGFSAFCYNSEDTQCNNATVAGGTGPQDITLSHNEISYNDACNWDGIPSPYWTGGTVPTQCGSSTGSGGGQAGGGKFWATWNTTFTNNYVHNNYSVGAWWDNDNTGEVITGNYFSDNFEEAVTIEISYNATVNGNAFIRNALGLSYCGGSCGMGGIPIPALYISNSGGNSNIASTPSGVMNIQYNLFQDNWDNVSVWSDSNRFCGSPGVAYDYTHCGLGDTVTDNPSGSYLAFWNGSGSPSQTYWNPIDGSGTTTSTSGCSTKAGGKLRVATPSGRNPDYWDNCQWPTTNVTVSNNTFSLNATNIDNALGVAGACENATNTVCGMSGLFSYASSQPPYSGVASGESIADQLTNCTASHTFSGCRSMNNYFANNTYTHTGSRNFTFVYWDFTQLAPLSIAAWQATGQDAGSLFS